jgi:hypothetical protein
MAETFGITPPSGTLGPLVGHTDKYNMLWDKLLQQGGQSTQVDQSDPNFRQQADTYAAGTERSRRNAVADNAESMSANMLGGSGAQAVANRSINEGAQQAQGTFEAQLVGKELQNKRAEIQAAISMAANLGNAEQQRALTQQLGILDAQIRAMGIQSNERIANNSLGFNYTQLEHQANKDAWQSIFNPGGG